MTSLVGGAPAPKWDRRIEACGELDELNATLGLLRLHSPEEGVDKTLESAQRDLFKLGAVLAGASGGGDAPDVPLEFSIQDMEADIDRLQGQGHALNSFVLPAGSAWAAHAHHARTVCRRAERRVASLHSNGGCPGWTLAYMNRFGDWLFAAAVFMAPGSAAANIHHGEIGHDGTNQDG